MPLPWFFIDSITAPDPPPPADELLLLLLPADEVEDDDDDVVLRSRLDDWPDELCRWCIVVVDV